MTQIGPIANPQSCPSGVVGHEAEGRAKSPESPAAPGQPHDRVDWSPRATDDIPTSDMEQRIADIRKQIAEGTYETPDKIDIVVERLLELLRPT
ncbi:MAG: hypothetical protein AB1601_13735 [Planctomycetota bacterium]